MAVLVWDDENEKLYETGCDHGVLYVRQDKAAKVTPISETAETHYSNGVVWNGLTSVSKSPSGAEANDIYADNIKYASLRSAETFGGTIEAYMYPEQFAECDGSAEAADGVYVGQQKRKTFGFSFRSDIGKASEGGIDVDNDYKIHLIYGATASPSEQQYSTINDSPEAITMSWELTTIPVTVGEVGGVKYLPTACLVIDATKTDPTKLKAFEDIIYGSASTAAMLPMPADVIAFFNAK